MAWCLVKHTENYLYLYVEIAVKRWLKEKDTDLHSQGMKKFILWYDKC